MKTKTYDVFISHALEDAAWAKQVADACRASGLIPFSAADIRAGTNVGDVVWEALSESRAVIVILSRPVLSQSVAIELGGARAWNKSIFGLLTDSTLRTESMGLSAIELYPANRIEDVIAAIKRGVGDFTENNRSVLAHVYSETDGTVDQLALDPRQLETLVKRFRKITGKRVSGERLLSELLRMRKQGKLNKSAAVLRAKQAAGTE